MTGSMMGGDDKSERTNAGAPLPRPAGLVIRPQVMPSGGQAPEPTQVVRLPDATPVQPRTATLFETVRIVDLSRQRMAIKRYLQGLERKGLLEEADPQRQRVLGILDAMRADAQTQWPEVVVLRRSGQGVIETNFALTGDTLYLGAHLSEIWDEGKEASRFYETLAEALLEHQRLARSRFDALPPKR